MIDYIVNIYLYIVVWERNKQTASQWSSVIILSKILFTTKRIMSVMAVTEFLTPQLEATVLEEKLTPPHFHLLFAVIWIFLPVRWVCCSKSADLPRLVMPLQSRNLHAETSFCKVHQNVYSSRVAANCAFRAIVAYNHWSAGICSFWISSVL